MAVDLLEKVVEYGTGTAARLFRPQFGKTGTEDLYRDAWFVGAIPAGHRGVGRVPTGTNLDAVPEDPYQGFRRTWPAQIWHAFMFNATKRMPVRDFPEPTEASRT